MTVRPAEAPATHSLRTGGAGLADWPCVLLSHPKKNDPIAVITKMVRFIASPESSVRRLVREVSSKVDEPPPQATNGGPGGTNRRPV